MEEPVEAVTGNTSALHLRVADRRRAQYLDDPEEDSWQIRFHARQKPRMSM